MMMIMVVTQGYGQIKEAFKALTKDNLLFHINLKMILNRLMMIMILVLIYTDSIYDNRKILKGLNL